MNGISLVAMQDWFADRVTKNLKELLIRTINPTIDDSILDVGGGTGRLAGIFAGKCKEVWVLELDRAKIQYGMKKRKNVIFIQSAVDAIPFEDAYFSKIIAIVSFHHFPNSDRALNEMRRVMKQDGHLAMFEIDPRTTRGKVVNFFENTVGHNGCEFYTPSQLEYKAKHHGFGEITSIPIQFGYLLTACGK